MIRRRFLRWNFTRSALHRGYWLVTSLYLVVDANLTAFQLVFLGTAQGVISFVAEVPAGVFADTISRKWSLVGFHLLLGASMVATSLVRSFPMLVATQMAWGVAGTMRSGADVAWVTDELADESRIGVVLMASARWEQVGAVVGMVIFGAAASLTTRSGSMTVAGALMILLGGYVVWGFPETNFVRATSARWHSSVATFQIGVRQAQQSRAVLLILIATVLVNGVAEIFGRLYPRRLVEVGFTTTRASVWWFAALGAAVYLVAAVVLFALERRVGTTSTLWPYIAACAMGAVGLVVLAHAPNRDVAAIGILMTGGIGLSVTRSISVIWVNQRVTSDVRATVHSFLAQAEYAGEVGIGFALASLAERSTISVAMTAAAALLAATAVLTSWGQPSAE
jgi:MFS family permease